MKTTRWMLSLAIVASQAGCGFGFTDERGMPDADEDDLFTDAGTDSPIPLDAVEGEEAPTADVCVPCDPAVGCDDGLMCNGQEECVRDEHFDDNCCRATPVECPSEDDCLVGVCVEERGGCVLTPIDLDGDGHPSLDCGYDDCNDGDYAVHPGARELCDDADNDCDGAIDEDAWIPDGVPILLSDPVTEPWSPSLAEGASAWGVAWLSDTGSGTRVSVGTIAPDGSPPAPSITSWNATSGTPGQIAMVPRSAGFAAVWTQPGYEGDEIRGVTVNADGTVAGAELVVLQIPGRILDLSAAVAGTSGRIGLFFRSDIEWDYEIYYLGVAWPPTAPAWDDHIMRITRSAGFSGRPSAVGLATGFALAWEDDRDGNTEIYFAAVSETGAVTAPARRITSAPGDSQNASLAASPGGFGLAWMDSRSGGYDLLFTFLDPTGARALPELSVEGGPERAWYPAIAYDGVGDQYAVAFAGLESGLSGARLTAVAPAAVPPPTAIDPGLALDGESVYILEPDVADSSGARGVIWLASDGSGTSTLYFQKLVCEVAP